MVLFAPRRGLFVVVVGRVPMQGSDAPLLSMRGVSKTYTTGNGTVAALRDVSISLAAGECVALVGPSGSGKSTFLSIAGGLLDPDHGGVASVCGKDWTGLNQDQRATNRRLSVGFIFQGLNLVSILTVVENAMLPLLLQGLSKGPARLKSEQALAALNLNEHADRWPHELSGGQQQRVAIARALAGGQPLLLADEPTGALDSDNSQLVFQSLADHANRGGASLVATHDPLVEKYATRLFRIVDGRAQRA